MRQYQEKHGDLVSASKRADGGEWGGDSASGSLPPETIEGMPLEWLRERLGEEVSRQVCGTGWLNHRRNKAIELGVRGVLMTSEASSLEMNTHEMV